MRYAMVCNNRVIDVLEECSTVPKWPNTLSGDPVLSIECTDDVTIGMMYNREEKVFFNLPTPTSDPVESVVEPTQLDRIESMVAKSQEEIANEAIDNYTLELMEAGVIV